MNCCGLLATTGSVIKSTFVKHLNGMLTTVKRIFPLTDDCPTLLAVEYSMQFLTKPLISNLELFLSSVSSSWLLVRKTFFFTLVISNAGSSSCIVAST
ncbi:MAG TPA: hypothetical protein PK566_16005 [Pseudobacteroides sp.]|nr:hypothetical protein [Pseudobacteroides sp.]